MVAIMTPEAAWIAHVADVVWMSSPRHLHLGKYVAGEDGDQSIARLLHEIGLGGEHIRMLRAIESSELFRDLGASFIFGGVVCLQKLQTLLVNPGQIGADSPVGHC